MRNGRKVIKRQEKEIEKDLLKGKQMKRAEGQGKEDVGGW